MIKIEVVYALAHAQSLMSLTLPDNCSVEQALMASGFLERFELNLQTLHVGIFGEKVTLETFLHTGDRVEIYRPLLIDPKEARRHRAKTTKQLNP
jgi:putative ubiquitin-RnfH superfamily antitoxin RatB of RatAB toxin-antitoxin module